MRKEMRITMVPSTLRLKELPPRTVHDVGEYVQYKTAEGELEVLVLVSDAQTAQPLPAIVHVAGHTFPANTPFRHHFRVEFDENICQWNRDLIWVECPGYESAEVDYDIEIDRELSPHYSAGNPLESGL